MSDKPRGGVPKVCRTCVYFESYHGTDKGWCRDKADVAHRAACCERHEERGRR